MLNPDSKLIYDILRSITQGDDVYKIIEADEIFALLPEGKTFTKVQLSSIIRELKDRDYISVKYFTPDEYCLLTMSRFDETQPVVQAEPIVEAVVEGKEKRERIRYEKAADKPAKSLKGGFVFLMAFLGALLGSAVITAVAIVLEKFVL